MSKELAKEIHAKAEPFVKWLKEAEEESEGSEEEEEEDADNVEVITGTFKYIMSIMLQTRVISERSIMQLALGFLLSPLQVVYSSSARELKMETTKPVKADKEEEDIDIDAI